MKKFEFKQLGPGQVWIVQVPYSDLVWIDILFP